MTAIKSILLFILAFAIILLLVTCTARSTKTDSKEIAYRENDNRFKDNASKMDARFVVDVVANNMAELKMAEVGEQLANTTEVKEIASMLKAQHMDIIDRFRHYAALRQISLPTNVSEEAKRIENSVVDSEGAETFDREWCNDIAKMYEESTKQFNEALPQLSDPELKDLATQLSPIVQLHYKKLLACSDHLE